jgi:hypothetical protein
MNESSSKESTRAIWQDRGRRYATGLNVCISSLLAIVLVAMVNYLAYRHTNLHWDISSLQYYTLSQKTKNLLESVDEQIAIITLFERNQPLFDEVSRLLKEYTYFAGSREGVDLTVEHVDPDQALVRTGELNSEYGITEKNVIIVGIKGRYKVLTSDDLVEYEIEPKAEAPTMEEGIIRFKQTKVGFRGEQMVSSAIQSLAQTTSPVIYFLSGHGERDIEENSSVTGYGRIASKLRRDNIDVRPPLVLEKVKSVPEDCDALIIAGADRRISLAERDAIASYLNHSGRVFLLIDPMPTIGLESLVEEWGIGLDQDFVVGNTYKKLGDLAIDKYGNHAITRALKGVVTAFYLPRSIEPLEAAKGDTPVDKPRVSILAITAKEGWAEKNFNENSPRFEEGIDRKGPISIAVAVERGIDEAQSVLDVDLRSTRMVVVGDSDFVSNWALSMGPGGNLDFFLNAINWLLDREELMAISPKSPIDLHLDMDREQQKAAFMLIVAALPLLMAVLGVVVWLNRRD